MQQVAKTYRIPIAALAAIMAQESGQVGKASRNKNGTYDYGPMQINTVWLKQLKLHGITEKDLLWNGCLNVYAAGAIFHRQYVDANKNIWKAVGRYHSKTPKYRDRYIRNVVKKMRSMTSLHRIVARANRYLIKLAGKASR
nr:lytic transglycosylase domain-containing protein [Methylomarinum sp. Ch1-1]MDP4523145.1 lytic transglycosylase domain-containing protein [Methylomarinum sp. Ch1-1]